MGLDILLNILKSLNWAQWGIAVCGIGVAAFTLVSAGIQQHEANRTEHENSLLNQDILRLSKEHLTRAEEAKKSLHNDVIASVAPDLRIDGGRVTDSRTYEINVTNYGKSTAEAVQLMWDYSYAATTIIRQRELPPGKTAVFSSQLFPHEENEAMNKAYAEIKERFEKGQRALIVRITIQHMWQGAPVQKEYTILWDGQRFGAF